tara:strand:+ start:3799 stop:4893 length:1095 start_codon:yes stop_codon:yes gene_type:complete
MPVAETFTVLGNRDGFDKCYTPSEYVYGNAVDVSDQGDYGKWTTFSGVSNDSPNATEELILESHKLALHYYWNTYSFNVSGTGSPVTEDTFPSFTAVGAAKKILYSVRGIMGGPPTYYFGWEVLGESEPKTRICRDEERSDPETQDYFTDMVEGGGGVYNGSQTQYENIDADGEITNVSPLIVRMYNGSTDNEANFVGWGAAPMDYFSEFNYFNVFYYNNSFYAATNAEEKQGNNRARADSKVTVVLCGATSPSPDPDGSSNTSKWFFNKVNLSGLWFIARVRCDTRYLDYESTGTTYVDGVPYSYTNKGETLIQDRTSSGASGTAKSSIRVSSQSNAPNWNNYNITATCNTAYEITGLDFWSY